MNKRSTARAAAVIEIGSNNVRMRVSQWTKGSMTTIDRLEYPVGLGHDVFSNGYISFDSLRELSSVLSKFSDALRSYNIEKPKVISCTALREAKNRALVVDQLKVRNGMDVTVLEDSQEKAYIYKEVIERLGDAKLQSGNTMIAYVGSGSIGVAVYDGQKVVYSQNISMGALKLHDVLLRLRQEADDFYHIIEEYLDTIFNRIAISRFQVKNLILTGSQLELVAQLCEAKKAGIPYQINTKKLSSLYQSIRSVTPEGIANRFGITEERAALLYTSLSIYHGLLRFCPQAENVISPPVDISEAMLRYELVPKAREDLDTYLRESAIACAETIASSFACNLDHSAHTGQIACLIFDKLKKIHGLDPSKRLLLELAAILHSCGSFVNVRQHNQCTFDLIKGMDIFGLRQQEVLETAFVAGSVSNDLTSEENPDFAWLPIEERIVISKLAAIFRLANALDKSHHHKIRDLKLHLEDDQVLFKGKASENTLLERWAFTESAQYFQEVFGLSPELAIKFDMI